MSKFEDIYANDKLPSSWLLYGKETGSEVEGSWEISDGGRKRLHLNIDNQYFSRQEIFNLAMILLKATETM